MKIPLLLHASPRIAGGPTVMLSKGSWEFRHNIIDSAVSICYAGTLKLLEDILVLNEDTPVRVVIQKDGTEKELTIYAILQ